MAAAPAPTAIIAVNDSVALGAMEALAARGLRVPEDVALVSFDGIPEATFSRPQLTTVAQPIREQGKLAARILLDRIEGKSTAVGKTRTMECEMVVRESTGKAAN